eukprot:353206-Chlamydomonas_euryale.AAC.9
MRHVEGTECDAGVKAILAKVGWLGARATCRHRTCAVVLPTCAPATGTKGVEKASAPENRARAHVRSSQRRACRGARLPPRVVQVSHVIKHGPPLHLPTIGRNLGSCRQTATGPSYGATFGRPSCCRDLLEPVPGCPGERLNNAVQGTTTWSLAGTRAASDGMGHWQFCPVWVTAHDHD